MTKQDFENQIASDPHGTTLRYVYADWLEEHGETVEAEKQRQWCQAKLWIVDFCDRYAQDLSDRYGDIGLPITYENLIQRISEIYPILGLPGQVPIIPVKYSQFIKKFVGYTHSTRMRLYCGPHMTFAQALSGPEGAIFWRQVCIIFGLSLDENIDGFLYSIAIISSAC